MTALEYILDGLEAELALERELGVRSIEIDRALLVAPSGSPVVSRPSGSGSSSASSGSVVPVSSNASSSVNPSRAPIKQPNQANKSSDQTSISCPLVFLHDRALSAAGVEMMGKIIAALGMTEQTAKVVTTTPLPPAKVYVVLGAGALKKWFPGTAGAPGQWIAVEGGASVLVTYSPEYILRFKTVTPAVKKIKMDMWTAIKSVLRKI